MGRVSQDQNRISKHENGIESYKGEQKGRRGSKTRPGRRGETFHPPFNSAPFKVLKSRPLRSICYAYIYDSLVPSSNTHFDPGSAKSYFLRLNKIIKHSLHSRAVFPFSVTAAAGGEGESSLLSWNMG